MQRALKPLAERQFDLLIIGGGVFGAAAAWDATLRGLSVALVERGDFGAGASAECFKMVHGGIRYLQHGDIRRLRSSCGERSALLRIAPHLVAPLPIAMPTYGWGAKGKPLLAAGMAVYDTLSFDRNRGIDDPTRRISAMRLLSRQRCLELFPGLPTAGLTGAAVFEDGQMYNPARVVLAYVQSAVARGAQAANYLEATQLLFEGQRAIGANVRCRLSGETFDIRAQVVLNAAGPGAEYLLQADSRFGHWQRGHFSRDAYFIVARQPTSDIALAIPGQTRDQDAVFSRSARHMFCVPWRNRTMLGVWHRVVTDHPDDLRIDGAELDAWIGEINQIYPVLHLSRDDVVFGNCGLVPFGDPKSTAAQMSFGKESRYLDHREQGISGLVSLVGIRFTTARADAATALDMLLSQLRTAPGRADTAFTPLHGGDVPDFPALLAATRATLPAAHAHSAEHIARSYGSNAQAVIAAAAAQPDGLARVGDSDTLLGEVRHAVRNEMAQQLDDVVLRRTDLGAAGHPGDAALETAAACMAGELGWSSTRLSQELAGTRAVLTRHHARRSTPEG